MNFQEISVIFPCFYEATLSQCVTIVKNVKEFGFPPKEPTVPQKRTTLSINNFRHIHPFLILFNQN